VEKKEPEVAFFFSTIGTRGKKRKEGKEASSHLLSFYNSVKGRERRFGGRMRLALVLSVLPRRGR